MSPYKGLSLAGRFCISVTLLLWIILPVVAVPPVAVTLTSELPSGNPDVDRISLLYFSPESPSATLRPAVILLAQIGSGETDPAMKQIASFLAGHDLHVALMTLPYHDHRWPHDQGQASPYLFYAGGDPVRNARSFRQAASDVSTVAAWLQSQSGVDSRRLGVCGISLGAIVAHMAMGRDNRLGVGVSILGGGDLADLYRNSFISRRQRLFHPTTRPIISWEEAVRTLSDIDPLTTADRNRPRHVFMVGAARDIIVPPRDVTRLWEALGRPPIRWVDSNHFSVVLNTRAMEKTAYAYFRSAWGLEGAPINYDFTPAFSTWTIKLGLLAQTRGKDSLGITPAVTYQAFSLGHRPDHMSIAHVDLGLSGRGPFLGIAATVTPYIDVGFASRWPGWGRTLASPRPYLSFHFPL